MNLQLQPSLATDRRSQIMLLLSGRLRDLDLGRLLSYWIDTVDPSVLPYLKWGFDLTNPLWQLVAPVGTTPTSATRAIIKLGIALHSIRGTPRAVALALQGLGWGPPAPAEPTTFDPPGDFTGAQVGGIRIYEGQDTWGGTFWPADQGWAVYRVVLPATTIRIADLPADVAWDPDRTYAAGDVVRYTGNSGPWFLATTAPPVGCPPHYFTIGAVGLDVDANGIPRGGVLSFDPATGAVSWTGATLGDMRWIDNVGALSTRFWVPLVDAGGVLNRVLTPADLRRIRLACEFFAPRSRWLDSVLLDQSQLDDQMFPWSDLVNPPDGVAVPVYDAMFPWSDQIITTLPALADDLAFVPDYGGAWDHAGTITHEREPVRMTDGAIVVDGVTRKGS